MSDQKAAKTMSRWSVDKIPDQSGRIAIVTGANTGLGYQTALALARAGAQVVIAARNPEKGRAAVQRIRAELPSARLEFRPLDLANLETVTRFSESISSQFDHVDLLINNAGVMTPSKRQTTSDGFELQFGTNFLGHFALTLHLLPQLRKIPGSRVVSLSSLMHKYGRIAFADLMSERNYSPIRSYSQSKLATLLFARELQRLSDKNGWGIVSVAAHPGIARTELTKSRPGQQAMAFNRISDVFAPLFTGTAASGALPSLYAGTDPNVVPGGYYGPTGWFEIRGPVGPAHASKASLDTALSTKLWTIAEELSGQRLP